MHSFAWLFSYNRLNEACGSNAGESKLTVGDAPMRHLTVDAQHAVQGSIVTEGLGLP